MRVLDRSVVGQLLDPLELIKATAMADLSAGRASVPPRIVARVDQLGLLAAMPAYSQSLNVLAAKQLTAGPYAQPGAYPPPQVSYPAPPPGATPPVIPAQRRAPEVDQKRPPEKREKKATGKILLAGSLGLLLGLLIGAALPRSTTGAAATSGTTKSAAGGTSAQSIDSAQAAPPAPLQAPVPAGTTDAAPRHAGRALDEARPRNIRGWNR